MICEISQVVTDILLWYELYFSRYTIIGMVKGRSSEIRICK